MERLVQRGLDEIRIPDDEEKSKFLERLRELLSKKFDLENPSSDEQKELSELAQRLMKFYNRYMRKVLI